MFSYFSKVLISGFLQFKSNFVSDQNNSKYRNVAPLTRIVKDELVSFISLNSFILFVYLFIE